MQTEPKPYDEAIMQELLGLPGIKEQVARMNDIMLEWYRQLLVKDGIYARYTKERESGKWQPDTTVR